MHSQASSLTDQDMADIAAFFTGKAVSKDQNEPEGKAPESAQVCVACHGTERRRHHAAIPHALRSARGLSRTRRCATTSKGGRKNAIMATFAQQIKEEDIEVLARYYSQAEARAGDGSSSELHPHRWR